MQPPDLRLNHAQVANCRQLVHDLAKYRDMHLAAKGKGAASVSGTRELESERAIAAGRAREGAARSLIGTAPAESAAQDRGGGATRAKRDQALGAGSKEAARELRERAEAAWCAGCAGAVRDRGLREALPLYKRALRECGGGDSAIWCSYARFVLLARASLDQCLRASASVLRALARARARVRVRV